MLQSSCHLLNLPSVDCNVILVWTGEMLLSLGVPRDITPEALCAQLRTVTDYRPWAHVFEFVDALRLGLVPLEKLPMQLDPTNPAYVLRKKTYSGDDDEGVVLRDFGVDSLGFVPVGDKMLLHTNQTKVYQPGNKPFFGAMATFSAMSRILGANKMTFSVPENVEPCEKTKMSAFIDCVTIVQYTFAEVSAIMVWALQSCTGVKTQPNVNLELIEDAPTSGHDSDAEDDNTEFELIDSGHDIEDNMDSDGDTNADTEEDFSDTDEEDDISDECDLVEQWLTTALSAGVTVPALRDGQKEALTAILKKFQDPVGRARICMPCGSGKTTLAILLLCIHAKLTETKCVLFSPLNSHVVTFTKKIKKIAEGVGLNVQMNTGFSVPDAKANIVVSTYNSASKLLDLNPSLVVIDEAHHMETVNVSAKKKTYRNDILKLKEGAQVLEMSATFRKLDTCDFVMSYEAAKQYGECAELMFIIPSSTVYTPDGQSDQLSPTDIKNGLINIILNNPQRHMRTLAYCNTINEAIRFYDLCKKKWQTRNVHMYLPFVTQQYVQSVLGEVPEWWPKHARLEHGQYLQDALSYFQNDGTQAILVSVQMLCEGIDIPLADTCMFVDPRHSSINIWQCIGRVNRVVPGRKLSAAVILPCAENVSELTKQYRILSTFGVVPTEMSFDSPQFVLLPLAYVEDDSISLAVMEKSLEDILRGELFIRMTQLQDFFGTSHKRPSQYSSDPKEKKLGNLLNYFVCQKKWTGQCNDLLRCGEFPDIVSCVDNKKPKLSEEDQLALLKTRMTQVQAFFVSVNKRPSSESTNSEERKLGKRLIRWVSQKKWTDQYNKLLRCGDFPDIVACIDNKKPNLSKEEQFALLKIQMPQVQAFFVKNNKRPTHESKDPEEKKLGQLLNRWVCQKKWTGQCDELLRCGDFSDIVACIDNKNPKLSEEEQLALLKAQMTRVQAYFVKTNKRPSQKSKDPEEKKLGCLLNRWVNGKKWTGQCDELLRCGDFIDIVTCVDKPKPSKEDQLSLLRTQLSQMQAFFVKNNKRPNNMSTNQQEKKLGQLLNRWVSQKKWTDCHDKLLRCGNFPDIVACVDKEDQFVLLKAQMTQVQAFFVECHKRPCETSIDPEEKKLAKLLCYWVSQKKWTGCHDGLLRCGEFPNIVDCIDNKKMRQTKRN